jgi:putative addiction module component (TIGR02574 family)
MTTTTQALLDTAIHLPPAERAELVEGILSSFDAPVDPAIDAAWAKEVEERIAALDRGEIATIPAALVFERAAKKFGK